MGKLLDLPNLARFLGPKIFKKTLKKIREKRDDWYGRLELWLPVVLLPVVHGDRINVEDGLPVDDEQTNRARTEH